MIKKILIPLYIDEVAPRFDLADEVLITTVSGANCVEEERSVLLPQASGEKLCQLILTEKIHTLICGAVEDEYYQFMIWKKIRVYDSVAGPASEAMVRFINNTLESGLMLWKPMIEGEYI